jgi:hypothetical protein
VETHARWEEFSAADGLRVTRRLIREKLI